MNELQPSPLARAAAGRSYIEHERDIRLISELKGSRTYTPFSPDTAKAWIDREALFLERLFQSREDERAVRALMLAHTYQIGGEHMLSRQSLPEDSPIADEQKPILARQSVEHITLTYLLDTLPKKADLLIKQMEEAPKLAEDEKIEVDDVFGKEEHFRQLIRRVSNPTAYTVDLLSAVKKFTYERELDITVATTTDEQMAIYRSQKLQADIPWTELAEKISRGIRTQILSHPEAQEDIKAWVERQRKFHFALIAEDVKRFWGTEGLELLPKDIRDGIKYYQENP